MRGNLQAGSEWRECRGQRRVLRILAPVLLRHISLMLDPWRGIPGHPVGSSMVVVIVARRSDDCNFLGEIVDGRADGFHTFILW